MDCIKKRDEMLFKNQKNQVRSGWIIFAALIIVFVGQGIFMLPGITLLSIIEMSTGSISTGLDIMSNPWMLLMTQGVGTAGGIAATLVVWRAINKKYPLELGLRGRGTDFLFGLFLGAASIAIIFFILLAT